MLLCSYVFSLVCSAQTSPACKAMLRWPPSGKTLGEMPDDLRTVHNAPRKKGFGNAKESPGPEKYDCFLFSAFQNSANSSVVPEL